MHGPTALCVLLMWGGVHSDAFLMPSGGAPSTWLGRTLPLSVGAAAIRTAARTTTISAQIQFGPPPEGFEWGYDTTVGPEASGVGTGGSPEELLLKAIERLREQDLDGASELLTQARAACEQAGGPTGEQSTLLELVAGRLDTAGSPKKGPRPPPGSSLGGAPTTRRDAGLAADASRSFPGTSAAPTGHSLILPGTPSMAELAAKMDDKRRAAAERSRSEQGGDGKPEG